MPLVTIEELTVAAETVSAKIKAMSTVRHKLNPVHRPFIEDFGNAIFRQLQMLQDRHMALRNALEFTMTLTRDPQNPSTWIDKDGTAWQPDEEIAYMLNEVQAMIDSHRAKAS